MTTKPTTGQCAHCRNPHGVTTDGVLQAHVTTAGGDYCPGSLEVPVPAAETRGILAWDLSDAFAKTEDDHHLDFGLGEIEAALPQIIAAIQTARMRASAMEAGS